MIPARTSEDRQTQGAAALETLQDVERLHEGHGPQTRDALAIALHVARTFAGLFAEAQRRAWDLEQGQGLLALPAAEGSGDSGQESAFNTTHQP